MVHELESARDLDEISANVRRFARLSLGVDEVEAQLTSGDCVDWLTVGARALPWSCTSLAVKLLGHAADIAQEHGAADEAALLRVEVAQLRARRAPVVARLKSRIRDLVELAVRA